MGIKGVKPYDEVFNASDARVGVKETGTTTVAKIGQAAEIGRLYQQNERLQSQMNEMAKQLDIVTLQLSQVLAQRSESTEKATKEAKAENKAENKTGGN